MLEKHQILTQFIMNISEIFYTIQGEGIHVGTPSTFIRTSGCNLRCDWCDTPYTSWEPETNKMDIEQIMEQVNKVTAENASHIVITGGEPFLQPDLGELVKDLHDQNYFVTIETNGTVYKEVGADIYSVSPKLANSTPTKERDKFWSERHEKLRINYESLEKFVEHPSSYFKFVIQTKEDLNEVDDLITKLDISNERIYLMPEGRTKDEVQSKTHEIIDLCKDRGFNFSPRLHIDIWGTKRGV